MCQNIRLKVSIKHLVFVSTQNTAPNEPEIKYKYIYITGYLVRII